MEYKIFAPINKELKTINNELTDFGITIEEIPKVEFPQTKFFDFLSPEYIPSTPRVLSSEDNSAKVEDYKIENNVLKITFSSKKTQTAVVEIFYKNLTLDVIKRIQIPVKITVDSPKAEFIERESRLNVNFNATSPINSEMSNLKYYWDFGDGSNGVFDSAFTQHKYQQAGQYKVKLKVENSDGVYDEFEKTINVTNSISFLVNVNPQGTYLFTDTVVGYKADPSKDESLPDVRVPATEFDLLQLYNNPEINLKAGDIIRIEISGAMKPGPGWGDEAHASMIGVFRGSGGFLFPGTGTYVPYIVTSPTCTEGHPTDIPQDFWLNNGADLVIPEGATSLQFSPNDCYFADNSDPNGDYTAIIKVTIINLNPM